MNSINIFQKRDYRKILHTRALEKKYKQGLSFTKLAEMCQVQPPYLSRVFKEEAHFNEDQLFLLSDFLGFDEDELLYIELLFKYQRSSLAQRKRKLKQQIQELKNLKLKTEDHLEAETVSSQNELNQQYFLSPKLQLVHLLLSLKKYKEDPDLILRKLNLSNQQYQVLINQLAQLSLIEVKKDKISVKKNHLFLSKDSPITAIYHALMKENAASRIHGLHQDEKYSLSVLFNGKKETFNSVRSKLITLLGQTENEVRMEKNSQELYQLSIDLFPWT